MRKANATLRGLRYLVIVLVIALLVDVAWTAIGLGVSLSRASSRFDDAGTALERFDFAGASDSFSGALDSTRSARELTRHPGFVAASFLPWVGRDVEGVGALARVANLAARAGLQAMGGAGAMGLRRDGLSALYSELRVQVGNAERAGPYVARVERLLHDAETVLDAAPKPTLAATDANLRRARATVLSMRGQVGDVSAFLRLLPGLVGDHGVRRYLLAFQGPNEARGGGGFIGLYATLEARRGRLALSHVGGINELIRRLHGPVDAPSWFEHNYGSLGSLVQWQQANLSPSFPAVARVLLNMYRASTGQSFDGVIAMDPMALASLSRATGSLQGPGMARKVDRHNAVRTILHDSYARFEPDDAAQNRYLAGLIEDFWSKLGSADLDATKLGEAFVQVARDQHLKIYARDPRDERTLSRLGLDGSFERAGPNLQFVFHNNAAANKVDYFLKTTIDTTVQLSRSGAADVVTTVSLVNRAPAGPPSYLLGPGINGDAAGYNRMLLNFVTPRGSEVEHLYVNGHRRYPVKEHESGFPLAWDIVGIPAGDTALATLSYRVPQAASLSSTGGHFDLTLWPQVSVTPDRFRLTVVPPEGFNARAQGAVSSGGAVRLEGRLRGPRRVHVELDPG